MKTYVPPSVKEAAMNRPDWPEIERRMKAIWPDWELVSLDYIDPPKVPNPTPLPGRLSEMGVDKQKNRLQGKENAP